MRSVTIVPFVAAGVALAGCGGSERGSSATTSTTPVTTRPPAASTTTAPPATTTTQAATTTAAATTTPPPRKKPVAPRPVVIRVEVKSPGQPVGGMKRATVKKGETVSLAVHSQVADEVHIHGYDLSKKTDANGNVRITFKATISGVFEIELEDVKLQIAELTVR